MSKSKIANMVGLLTFTLVAVAGCSRDGNVDTAIVQADTYLDVADLYREQGQFRSALIETQNALQLAPGSERARILTAQISMDIGDINRAMAILEPLTESRPDSELINLMIAEAHVLQNEPQAALNVLLDTKILDPEQQIQRDWILGRAHSALENSSAARNAFESVLLADSSHANAMIELSKLEFRENNTESNNGVHRKSHFS